MIIVWAVPVFVLTMFIEWRLTLKHDGKGYWLKDSAASLTLGNGNLLLLLGTKFMTFAIYMAVYDHRLVDLPVDVWWVWL